MSDVLVPVRRNGLNRKSRKQQTLEEFARAIEVKLKRGAGPDAVANYICRLLTSSDEKVAAAMWCKWVEWRYGKAKEHLEHTGANGAPIKIISPATGRPARTRRTRITVISVAQLGATDERTANATGLAMRSLNGRICPNRALRNSMRFKM